MRQQKLRHKSTHRGLSLIELLVVIALIGIISIFAYPKIETWLTTKEIEKEVYQIVDTIKKTQTELQTGNKAIYIMKIENVWNNGGLFKTLNGYYRSQSQYKQNQQCNSALSWTKDNSISYQFTELLNYQADNNFCLKKRGEIMHQDTRTTVTFNLTSPFIDNLTYQIFIEQSGLITLTKNYKGKSTQL